MADLLALDLVDIEKKQGTEEGKKKSKSAILYALLSAVFASLTALRYQPSAPKMPLSVSLRLTICTRPPVAADPLTAVGAPR